LSTSSSATPGSTEAGRIRHVGERALAGVAEEPVLPDDGDKDVLPAVVVVVGGRHAHPVELHLQACGLRRVAEAAVSLVPVQAHVGWSCLRLSGPGGAVDEQDVLASVVVEVEERGAGAQRLGQVLLAEGAVVVGEGDAGRLRHVDEAEGERFLRAHGRVNAREDQRGGEDGEETQCAEERRRHESTKLKRIPRKHEKHS